MKAGTTRSRALPQRSKPSLFARVRPFWVLALVALALLGWGAAWFVQAPAFRVMRVGVDTPLGSPVSREDVRRAAAIPPGANVWLLDPRTIARNIDALPYVAAATIHRGQWPQPFVELGISVRRAANCVRGGARLVTIDATSRVLQSGCALPAATQLDAGAAPLPAPGATIDDANVARLLADNLLLAGSGVPLKRIGFDRYGGLEAVDGSGVILRFGDDGDLAKKAALLGPVRAGIGSKRPLRAIDLRAPDTPTVEFR